MDDLQIIRDVLAAPPPSARATVQARHQLATAIAAPQSVPSRHPRLRSLRWSLGGAAAFAGIATAVLAATTITPGQPPHATPGITVQSPTELSAHDILLAAANRAARAESGRYWHVQRVTVTGPVKVGSPPNEYDLVGRWVTDNWIAREPNGTSWIGRRELGFRPRSAADQQAWRQAGSPKQWDILTDSVAGLRRLTMEPGQAELIPDNAATTYLLDLGGFNLAQVQQLPTDPAQLRALFVARIAAEADGFGANTWGSNIRLFGSMSQLLLDVPAPPKVRAAAFTVLAEIPGMRSTGEVKDPDGR